MRLISTMAPCADPFIEALGGWLGQQLDLPVEVHADADWRVRERRLDSGNAELGFICGLPYVVRKDAGDPDIELLAAPVFADPRLDGRPVYISDVLVRRDSRFERFEDLRGCRWAFNEPCSQSGFNVTRWHLSTLGEDGSFFGEVVEGGAHASNLEALLAGRLDATAIDSTVLAALLRARPELADSLRCVASLGPSPAPPFVISRAVPAAQRQAIRAALHRAHEDFAGRAALQRYGILRLAPVDDAFYDRIRGMYDAARRIDFGPARAAAA